MNLKITCLAGLISSLALFGQDPPEVESLKKGQPKDVQSFIRRVFLCEHWAGEEPYDEDRTKEINKAVTGLRCHELAFDEARLRRKYRKNPRILAALNAAKNS